MITTSRLQKMVTIYSYESYHCQSAYSWVRSVTVCRNSDLAASGAGNGSVRLWEIESETKDIRPFFDHPLVSQSNIKNNSYIFLRSEFTNIVLVKKKKTNSVKYSDYYGLYFGGIYSYFFKRSSNVNIF